MVKFKKFVGTILASAIIFVCGIAFMPKTAAYAANYEIKVELGKTYAYDENGVKALGWQTINGNEYYFDEDGAAVTGIQSVRHNGILRVFYFDENGVLQSPVGWLTVDGKTYYFPGTYSIPCAMSHSTYRDSDKRYEFDDNGVMLTNCWSSFFSDMYYGEDGTAVTGLQTINGKIYYFINYHMQTKTGWQFINGDVYYFGEDGAALKEWQTIDGKKYYFGEDGSALRDLQVIDGNKYYFDNMGVMQTGWCGLASGKHYFDENGIMQTGWFMFCGYKYYLGEDGAAAKGWQIIDGNKYYFDSEGVAYKRYCTIAGRYYEFDEEGIYLAESDFPIIENKDFCWYSVDGVNYWYENGCRQGTEGRGKEIYDPKTDAWYWLDSIQNGAVAISKDVYQESNGGKWVRYDADGHMVKGWDTNENGKYYFDPITGAMAKGVVNIFGTNYRFDDNTGIMLNLVFVNDNGNDYWYENGIKQGTEGRGKEIYDLATDAWYWLDAIDGGKKATSKDVYQESNGGKWVRYDADGHMIKGWQTNENGTYYFDLVTGAMTKGSVIIDNNQYDFDTVTGITSSVYVATKYIHYHNMDNSLMETDSITYLAYADGTPVKPTYYEGQASRRPSNDDPDKFMMCWLLQDSSGPANNEHMYDYHLDISNYSGDINLYPGWI